VAQEIEHLPSKCKALLPKKKKEEEEKKNNGAISKGRTVELKGSPTS
jgi:hypothetical protein